MILREQVLRLEQWARAFYWNKEPRGTGASLNPCSPAQTRASLVCLSALAPSEPPDRAGRRSHSRWPGVAA